MALDAKPADETLRLYGNPSVDYDSANYDLTMTWYRPDGTAQVAGVARIPVEDLIDFIQNTTRSGGYALRSAISNLHQGQCDTCQNVRLVDEERPNGSTWSVRCPDCKDAYDESPLKHVPTIGPKVKPGFEPQSRRSGL